MTAVDGGLWELPFYELNDTEFNSVNGSWSYQIDQCTKFSLGIIDTSTKNHIGKILVLMIDWNAIVDANIDISDLANWIIGALKAVVDKYVPTREASSAMDINCNTQIHKH